MLRKIRLKFLQNKLKKEDIEIVVLKDNKLQALKKLYYSNKYIVISMPCNSIRELKKDLKQRVKNEKVFY